MNQTCLVTSEPNDQLGPLLRAGAARAWSDARPAFSPEQVQALASGVPVRVSPVLEGTPSYSFWRDLAEGRIVAALTVEDPSSPSGKSSVALGYLDLDLALDL